MIRKSYAAYIMAASEELEAYLLSDQLFWGLRAPAGYTLPTESTQLTPGNLLLAERIVKCLQDFRDKSDLDQAECENLAIRNKWKSHWFRKIDHEFDYRLKEWKSTAMDFSKRENKSEYNTKLRSRIILDLLVHQQEDQTANRVKAIQAFDSIVLPYLTRSDFLWDSCMVQEFPEESFPFLYREIAK